MNKLSTKMWEDLIPIMLGKRSPVDRYKFVTREFDQLFSCYRAHVENGRTQFSCQLLKPIPQTATESERNCLETTLQTKLLSSGRKEQLERIRVDSTQVFFAISTSENQ